MLVKVWVCWLCGVGGVVRLRVVCWTWIGFVSFARFGGWCLTLLVSCCCCMSLCELVIVL